MFDKDNPADLLALKAELVTDPFGMGYVLNKTAILLEQLNQPANNAGPTESTRTIDQVQISEVSAVIDTAEYDALSNYDKEWIKAFIAFDVQSDLRHYKDKFLSIFTQGTATKASVINLLTVENSSRAEALFGWGSIITRNDLIAAREAE